MCAERDRERERCTEIEIKIETDRDRDLREREKKRQRSRVHTTLHNYNSEHPPFVNPNPGATVVAFLAWLQGGKSADSS